MLILLIITVESYPKTEVKKGNLYIFNKKLDYFKNKHYTLNKIKEVCYDRT